MKGGIFLQFSEPVFEIEDIKEKKTFVQIPKDPERRRMQQSFEVEDVDFAEKPYIEVTLLPGENSDVSKLGFDWEVVMKDEMTLDIVVNFENPVYVSAQQPEDFIEITLWGPFFNKEDGLQIDFD